MNDLIYRCIWNSVARNDMCKEKDSNNYLTLKHDTYCRKCNGRNMKCEKYLSEKMALDRKRK